MGEDASANHQKGRVKFVVDENLGAKLNRWMASRETKLSKVRL